MHCCLTLKYNKVFNTGLLFAPVRICITFNVYLEIERKRADRDQAEQLDAIYKIVTGKRAHHLFTDDDGSDEDCFEIE